MKKQQGGGTRKRNPADRRDRTRTIQGNAARKQRKPKPAGGMGGPGRQLSVASAYATGQSSGTAQVFRNSVNSCRMVHRELIASITGSTAFAVPFSFALNPGLAATFPWLSIEAQGWQSYKFNKLRFCYYTRTGSNVPGSVLLVPDYDASDAAPVSEQVASNYEDTEEDAPWKDIKCICSTKALAGGESMKFVRTGGLPANQDVKTFDAGNLFVCTIDGTAVNWGKVWVEYDVTFFTPQLPQGGAFATGVLVGGGGSLAAATPFGSAPTPTGSFAMNAAATNVLSFTGLPIGAEILVSFVCSGTVITVASTFGTLVGLTLKTSLFLGFPVAATSSAASATFIVTANNASLVVSITATTVTSSSAVVAVLTPPPIV